MPSQKRSNDSLYEDDDDDVELQRNNQKSSEESEQDDVEQDERESDDDGSPSSSCSDKEEYVFVKLADVRKEVQCPICLGIIRKTRKVMECLHRFCRECIDKSMRMGNNECPACRAHCASRRSLRDDPNYDTLIEILYPDIDKYEEEELAFHEEEKARNKQIQASIAQTSRRQLEALGKKRATAKATATAFMRRSQGNTRNLRGRKSRKSAEPQGSDNEIDADNDIGGKYSSSTDEPSTEIRPKRYKRWAGAQSLLPPSSGGNGGGCDDNESETTRKSGGGSIGLGGSPEILAWGRGGMRSHTRHGGQNSSAGKSAKNSQLAKLIDHLQKLPQNDDKVLTWSASARLPKNDLTEGADRAPTWSELLISLTQSAQDGKGVLSLDLELKLVSLDEQNIPNLQNLYLYCSPATSTAYFCQYVALENGLQADELELFLVKEEEEDIDPSSAVVTNPLTDELRPLDEHQILSDLTKISNNLTIAYKKKEVKSL